MRLREHSSEPNGGLLGKCEAVIPIAVEKYPRSLGMKAEKLREFFLSGVEMNPVALREIQPAYLFFEPSGIHPLLYSLPHSLDSGREGKRQVAVAFIGPSAGGKDSTLKLVESQHPNLFEFVITTTTRPPSRRDFPRPRYRFISEGMFHDLQEEGMFIEYIPKGEQGEHLYGTTIEALEETLKQPAPVKVWRGDIYGLPEMRAWMGRVHPEVPFLAVFILPRMTLPDYCTRLERKRGVQAAHSWRFAKAIWEIHEAPLLVDVLLLNPPDPSEQPREAAEATVRLFNHLVGMGGIERWD